MCRERVDDALKVLGTDYIDILTLRLGTGPDSKGTSLEETARGMKVLNLSNKTCIRAYHQILPEIIWMIRLTYLNTQQAG